MMKINLGYPEIIGTVHGVNVPEPWFCRTGYSGLWHDAVWVRKTLENAYKAKTDSDELGRYAYDTTVINYLDPFNSYLKQSGYNICVDKYINFLEAEEPFIVPIPSQEFSPLVWKETLEIKPRSVRFPDRRWMNQIPVDILKACRNGKAFFLFYSLWEACTIYPKEVFEFANDLAIPVESIILATPNLRQKDLFEKYKNKPNIVYWNSFKDFPWVGPGASERSKYLENWKTEKPVDRSKKFLCLNRRWCAERLFLSGHLRAEHANSSIISVGKTEYQSTIVPDGNSALRYMDYVGLNKKTEIFNTIRNFYRKFGSGSICTSPDSLNPECMENATWASEDLQKQAYVNIVTETNFSYASGDIFFTEKIYKPVWCLQPFILVSVPHALKAFRSLGYQTFDRWWDESYDDVVDYQERLEAICKLVDELDKKPLEWFKQTYIEMEDVLVSNWERYSSSDLSNYSEILDKFYSIVSSGCPKAKKYYTLI